ncbi:hypothetical protein SAMN05660657_01155 [Geodermatophilus amargosae]|uniref:Uncharacterized protein n=1 Tax=Geodermatophilus amargosae TaxID=1296565 RepID=A0A1I6YK19_9ACTN|nr:hypothetical protein [Geodermatophilus amargosae]SFT50792.1 hypothetical protein SAMN05660657_01155 [Geodermatophilus amargosae]
MTSPRTSPTATAACHRHPRHVWIANCPDCTAWYLAGLRAASRERDRAA